MSLCISFWHALVLTAIAACAASPPFSDPSLSSVQAVLSGTTASLNPMVTAVGTYIFTSRAVSPRPLTARFFPVQSSESVTASAGRTGSAALVSGLSDAAGVLAQCLSVLEVINPDTTHGSNSIDCFASEMVNFFTVSIAELMY